MIKNLEMPTYYQQVRNSTLNIVKRYLVETLQPNQEVPEVDLFLVTLEIVGLHLSSSNFPENEKMSLILFPYAIQTF